MSSGDVLAEISGRVYPQLFARRLYLYLARLRGKQLNQNHFFFLEINAAKKSSPGPAERCQRRVECDDENAQRRGRLILVARKYILFFFFFTFYSIFLTQN